MASNRTAGASNPQCALRAPLLAHQVTTSRRRLYAVSGGTRVPVPAKLNLVLLVHAHQPVGNFDSVFEQTYARCYRPFVEILERHPKIHIGLHYSGPLLTWIEHHHPEYLEKLRILASTGQVEMVGGGFYEPILISIPPADQHEQITRLADYVERHFGKRPSGAWLAERVWEPQLASALAAAGVAYTVLDDIHFLSAGFEPGELFADYIAEDQGQTIRIIPGQKSLRYLIPWDTVDKVTASLRETAATHPDGIAAMGDDMEKFGGWPGTFDHCYQERWLDALFHAFKENASWLNVATPSEYLAAHRPKGRADLPTASYTEMMEWALPTPTRKRYNALLKEFASRSDVLAFLRGSPWRGFFRKYSESNLLHKKMFRVSQRLAAAPKRRAGSKAAEEMKKARDLLLRAQCNDAYWHGIFGGLYAPHLRTELWRTLIRAEDIADRQTPGALTQRVETLDYDGDGSDELLFTSPDYQALLKPSDGGTLAVLDFRRTESTLINSILRRPEPYHARLRDPNYRPATSTAAAYEQTKVKEAGLERFLRYDRWPRHTFRLFVFDPKLAHADYEALELHEGKEFAGGAYCVERFSPNEAELRHGVDFRSPDRGEVVKICVSKRFSFGPAPQGCEIACEVQLDFSSNPQEPLAVGVESVVNLLAPSEPDRFFDTPDGPRNLRFSGTLLGPALRMEDGWQKLRITLQGPGVQQFWVAPIETVSESEEGFERVYQGSQILAVWYPELSVEKSWKSHFVWRVEAF
jgi:4-alpha-glucanotransferase